jgi:hypothetical protein
MVEHDGPKGNFRESSVVWIGIVLMPIRIRISKLMPILIRIGTNTMPILMRILSQVLCTVHML